jgi:hypothetical protein
MNLKSANRKVVGVQVPLRAPTSQYRKKAKSVWLIVEICGGFEEGRYVNHEREGD